MLAPRARIQTLLRGHKNALFIVLRAVFGLLGQIYGRVCGRRQKRSAILEMKHRRIDIKLISKIVCFKYAIIIACFVSNKITYFTSVFAYFQHITMTMLLTPAS